MLNDPILIALLLLQIFMGAFDTLFHHEMTQRLGWSKGQQFELRLHGVRNLIYAAVFLMLGLTAPAGAWAIALMALLVIELGITLVDFVEEDRVRLLPASERVTHTLLTLNYGVVLALLLPKLFAAAQLPSALPFVWQGWLATFLALSALSVIIFGLRDLFAARRLDAMAELGDDPAALASALPPQQRVLVAGGTGFVGSRLVEALVDAGHEVSVLTRSISSARHLRHPVKLMNSLDWIADEHPDGRPYFDAIINLAGASVAGGLWTAKRKQLILDSRAEVAQQLHDFCRRQISRPPVYIAASAVGYYGDSGEAVIDEGSTSGQGFAAESCREVEALADRFALFGMRIVKLRIGMVLAHQGGLVAQLLLPFEFGAGGPIGNGRQWMSWIHRDDLVRAIVFCMARKEVSGAVNAVAPNPVRQRDFARAFGRILQRPAFMPLPTWLLKPLLGEMADDLFLASQKALPVKLLFNGFRFRHGDIDSALPAALGIAPPKAKRSVAAQSRQWKEARLLS
ncbi:TIGR01777 family oxidoreductase [Alterisphingorhabdus coralli]|uniref:TIGR01777 family oxidoreductase n=1 Tax=Alterisphingorhabdus coralli TaxID=3071408 RepID=A0AA97FA42_9SPHN|nr:TIGR01777 family oxidoreductase [Parasphingorhabdus sp. SCSIO 66989]WOE75295.1 TIGR01777 family oxidoreductase [Parasphingorhabdus sp. SCSIO 66989]